VRIEDWFLTTEERANSSTSLPAWCEGSVAEPLVHGAAYFARLVDEVEALVEGDHLFFTDWRGDPDQLMREGGPSVGDLFSRAAARGVVVKGLMWCSHVDRLQYGEEENRHLGDDIEH
jgi:hypothetical protein